MSVTKTRDVTKSRLKDGRICSIECSRPFSMSRRGGTFGLTASRRARGSFRGGSRGFYKSTRGRGGRSGNSSTNAVVAAPTKDEEGTQLAERFERVATNDEVDEKLGFARIQEGQKKEGWLINMHPVCRQT